MRRPRLSPGTAALFMVGLGAASLMGLPGVGTLPPPAGSLAGRVVDEDGAPVAGARVALFHGDELALLEWTSTDLRGRFAFQESPEAFHVFAAPLEERRLAGAWSLARSSALPGTLELELRRGRWVDVLVTDPEARPVEGAEVRAYDRRERLVVVARVATDASGRARVLVPREAHVGVLGGASGRLAAWAFDLEPAEGELLRFVLPPARRLSGRAVDEQGAPLPGTLVCSWDQRAGAWHWNGYRPADAFGEFHLPRSEGETWLRAVDRTQTHLPALRRLGPEDGGAVELVLPTGLPLELRCASRAGDDERVWIWNGPTSGWSWGSRLGRDGRLRASVAERHGIVLAPLTSRPGSPGAAGGPGANGSSGTPGLPDDLVQAIPWDQPYAAPVLDLDAVAAPAVPDAATPPDPAVPAAPGPTDPGPAR